MSIEYSDILRSLGRIEGQTEAILERLKSASERLDGHDARLREVEGSQSQAAGRSSVLGTLAGALSGGIASWLARHI